MDLFSQDRKYKNDERIRYILSRPFECRSIMKKFYQCVDFKEFKNNLSFKDASQQCSEFDYNGCLAENSKKLFENRIFNVNKAEAGGEEEEE